MKRREFLGGSVALAGLCTLAADEKTTDGGFAPVSWADRLRKDLPLLPAGAQGVDRFLSKCVACGLCVTACPSKCLRPSDDLRRLGRVELDFRHGWCRPSCHACADVCPTGAIAPVDIDRKRHVHIGFASIRTDLCLRTAKKVDCHACEKHCPVKAVRILSGVPVVNRDACIGCGACEHYCPVRPVTAIAVTPVRLHRAVSPVAEADLLTEMRAQIEAGKACVAAAGGVIFAAPEGRGVDPALALLKAEPARLKGSLVVDKIVGRAAAAIWIQAGVRKVCACVMSEGAVALFDAHGVAHAAECVVPAIRNREGTGLCPMDTRTQNLTDPAEIVRALSH